MLHLGKIQQFLQKAMQPPDEKAVANAIFSLKRMVGPHIKVGIAG